MSVRGVPWGVTQVSNECSRHRLVRQSDFPIVSSEHDLVELFAKRAFRCDCGTLSLCRGKKGKEAQLAPCALRSKELSFAPQNDENVYNKNFDGGFCRCERGKAYNPETEEEVCSE